MGQTNIVDTYSLIFKKSYLNTTFMQAGKN